MMVRPTDMPQPADVRATDTVAAEPGHDAAPDDIEAVSDQTVIMKPSQRAREAAAALSVERRRAAELARAALPTQVDFDVTQGGEMPALPPTSAPRTDIMRYLVGAAVIALLALAALFLL